VYVVIGIITLELSLEVTHHLLESRESLAGTEKGASEAVRWRRGYGITLAQGRIRGKLRTNQPQLTPALDDEPKRNFVGPDPSETHTHTHLQNHPLKGPACV